MKKKLKELISGLDATVGCYMIAGMLLMIVIVELAMGHWFRAFNSFIYTFIVFCCSQLIHQNKHLKRLLVLQHMIIEVLEDKAGISKEEDTDHLPPVPDEDAKTERMSKKWDELLEENKPKED